jgi:hypothetical protein
MSSAGFTRPGLKCKHGDYQKDFSLLQARPDMGEPDELPDPFSAKCPHCDREANYTKAEIGNAYVVGERLNMAPKR